MGTNPNISQGVLNRVRGSVQSSLRPDLNITAPYLGEQGITFTPTGKAVNYLKTLTGAARSPEVYMMMEGVINLLKTQSLSNAYKTAMETDSNLGTLTVRPDASQLGVYTYLNCSITGVDRLLFNGTEVGYMVQVEGIYQVNSNLFNGGPTVSISNNLAF